MSRSTSRVDVQTGKVQWALTVQVESIMEVLPELDLDGDKSLQWQEVLDGRGAIDRYLSAHYGLKVSGGSPSELDGVLIAFGGPDPSRGLAVGEWVESTWEAPIEDPIDGVFVRMELFRETSPDHFDIFELCRSGRVSNSAKFDAGHPGAWVPFADGANLGFFQWGSMGFQHILTGWDHLAFLLAILMCVRGAREAAIVVTSFTVAHSITLALAAFGAVEFSDRFVELVIALSITFMATGGWSGGPRKGLWLEAGLFGLVHGLGFAGFLRAALPTAESWVIPLTSFNLGVEIGQLCFLGPMVLLVALIRGFASSGDGPWIPDIPRKFISVAVGAAGVYWFILRAGWAC